MIDFAKSKPGDLECVCAGTGLICTLVQKEGETVVDPDSVAICDCVLGRLERVEVLEEALRDVVFHTGLGESKDGTIQEIRETVNRVLPGIWND